MPGDVISTVAQTRAALLEALGNQRRAQVFNAVCERPGVTLKQIAHRLAEPPRSVRYQLERLEDAGLVVVDAETPKGNARERHYKAEVLPTIDSWEDSWTDQERRSVAVSVLKLMLADFRRAVDSQIFGIREGSSQVRIPGEVDDRGWQEMAQIEQKAMVDVERVMKQSAARLQENGEAGTEAIAIFLLFETLQWDPQEDGDSGPRRTLWWTGDASDLPPSPSQTGN